VGPARPANRIGSRGACHLHDRRRRLPGLRHHDHLQKDRDDRTIGAASRRRTSVRSASAGSARGRLREGLGYRPLHLTDGVVLSTDSGGNTWRTAVEVELTRKTEARVAGILRQLLKTYDDVVY
jgi:hypothetical protein